MGPANTGGESRLSDIEVARGFDAGELSGRLAMDRFLTRIGRSEHAEQTLVKRDGKPLLDEDENAVEAAGYLDYLDGAAGKQHVGAKDTIVKFLMVEPSGKQYELMRGAMTKVFDGYLGIDAPPSNAT